MNEEKKLEPLTKETYRSNHDYMSYSRFSRFLSCEAAAAASFYEPTSVAQLIGSYVDAYFSGEMDEFKTEHPEIVNSRTGELKSDFTKANSLIERIESDELLMDMLSGDKQVIMTGKIDGVPFKIKMDSYIPGKAIVDLKVMRDFKNVWSDAFNSYVNFIEGYNYDIELAIFQEIVYQNTGEKLPCYIAAITKEEPSDVGVFKLPQQKLDEALNIVRHNLPHIRAILDGKEEPQRCEHCAYCRATKKARILNWDLAGLNGDKLRENGVECNDPLITKQQEK